MIQLPQFASKADMFKYMKANKDLIIQAKKSADKYADAVNCLIPSYATGTHDFASKEIGTCALSENTKSIVVKAAINTTNILDSHGDVHIPGLWKKSIQETKNLLHLQEHKMAFDHVLSRNVTATTKKMSWSSLGYEWPGNTEVLVFESKIDLEPHTEFMHAQYLKGNVNNHSVGMRYVDLLLCINSTDKYYSEENANWDKYIPQVVNYKDAEEEGMFWAVTTAKVIEGSAVVRGSNYATPTISIMEAVTDTSNKIQEPPVGTQIKQLNNIIQQIKF